MRNQFRSRLVPRFLILEFLLLIISCWALYGCSVGQYIQPKEISYENLSACYNRIKPKVTSSLDVLEMLQKPGYVLEPGYTEMLSQSDTAVASLGQSKNGYQTWFTVVVFNEKNMTAERKYFYFVNEKARTSLNKFERLPILPSKGLIFDCQIVLPAEVLQKPYVTEEAKQIAILKHVAQNLRKDTDELSKAVANEPSQGNQNLAVAGMFMDQVFKTVLLELDKSPAMAKSLDDNSGVRFNHMNFDEGKIRMTIDGSIVTVEIKLGCFTNKFEIKEGST